MPIIVGYSTSTSRISYILGGNELIEKLSQFGSVMDAIQSQFSHICYKEFRFPGGVVVRLGPGGNRQTQHLVQRSTRTKGLTRRDKHTPDTSRQTVLPSLSYTVVISLIIILYTMLHRCYIAELTHCLPVPSTLLHWRRQGLPLAEWRGKQCIR